MDVIPEYSVSGDAEFYFLDTHTVKLGIILARSLIYGIIAFCLLTLAWIWTRAFYGAWYPVNFNLLQTPLLGIAAVFYYLKARHTPLRKLLLLGITIGSIIAIFSLLVSTAVLHEHGMNIIINTLSSPIRSIYGLVFVVLCTPAIYVSTFSAVAARLLTKE